MDVHILQEQLIRFKTRKSISIISNGIIQHIPIGEITHISTYGNESVLYTKELEYRTPCSLRKLKDELPSAIFFRIHRSHIISLRHMEGVKRRRIRAGKHYLPISTASKLELVSRLQESVDRAFVFFDEPGPL